ncbi:MAG: SgcJ/EcaC family oxidoreductase [Pseudomonadota bacterium]|nr:SgcJ/EcaC family oxidoreductase [Pseudomonadota bacterium]
MSAQTPEDIDRLFAEALNAGKLDALVALYEPQATLAPMPDKLVTGTAAIREALAGFLAGKPRMSLTPRLVAQAGELAVVSAKWELSMTGTDGKPANMTGQSVEVVRRQPDGRWLFAIDLPFGTGA